MITKNKSLLVESSPLFRIPHQLTYFVSRPHEEDTIIRLIEQSSHQSQNSVVLYGSSGYGKSTLALAICHNPRIEEIFDGDICWIEPRKLKDYYNTEINYGELAQKLIDRHCLVVLDGLEEKEELEKFLRVGEYSYCTWLITTRRLGAIDGCKGLHGCQNIQSLYIGGMRHNEAEQLLISDLPKVDRNKLKRLLDQLYEFPLLINLVREKISYRLDRESNDIDKTLDSVDIDKTLDSVIEDFQAGIHNFDTHTHKNDQQHESELSKRFSIFLDQLTLKEQEYFKDLFIFPSHVEIPLSTIDRLWHEENKTNTRNICEKFHKLSLVTFQKNTVTLNDFLRKYWINKELKEKLPYLHQKLLNVYEELPEETKLPEEEERYLYHYLPYHLKKASKRRIMHILHLSDLHFTTSDQATLGSTQLRLDLRRELNISKLDALILSGDIANYSTPEEYEAAAQFLNTLCQTFSLNPEQITIVPGNHDLNWKLAEEAYQLIDRPKYNGKLIDGHYIHVRDEVIRVRDETAYKKRFDNFRQFYETIKQKPYPLDYDQQYTLDYLPEQNLLILGLNSAWQLDHHFTSRASIHVNALINALDEIDTNPDYDNCLKIAVWHHPLDSPYQDRIIDQDFIGLLAVSGFRFFLHGHIHKAETSLFRYDMSRDGRKLDRICAGTFGAPTKELVTATPWQYNLLIVEKDKLTVRTRCRRRENAPWESDSVWRQGAGKSSLDYYTIEL